MRLIFIPGFAEDEKIFGKLTPLLDGEKLVLNSWKLVGDQHRANFNALKFAHEFVETYSISKSDILIGHSMGGWIAYFVKHLVGCPIIQVASLTNTDRIKPPVFHSGLMYWFIRKGLAFNRFTTWLSSFGLYHHHYSHDIFMYFAGLLRRGDRENIVNQLKLLLTPVDEVITVEPDVRIHGTEDNILRPPVESFYEVSGDHFILYTNAGPVAFTIKSFLKREFSALLP